MDLISTVNQAILDATTNSEVEQERKRCKAGRKPYCTATDNDGTNIRSHFPFCLIGSELCVDHIRIKCNASSLADFSASAGWYILDKVGNIIHVGKAKFKAGQAEAFALQFAFRDAFSGF